MFKIGDIIVKTKTTNSTNRLGSKEGDIWKINRLTNFNHESAYYPDGNSHSVEVRKATEDEIKWFEAGITNINQIPEVGGTYIDGCGNTVTIIGFTYNNRNSHIRTKEKGNLSLFGTYVRNRIQSYKPPVKSQHVGNEVPIDTPFEVGDLKNCKIGNLTPEDHKIIQPWLFSLGYEWRKRGRSIEFLDKDTIICRHQNSKNYLYCISNSPSTIIKKETILNYIKQLNTNKNYEQINKKREIKPESGRISNRRADTRNYGSICSNGTRRYSRNARIS